MNKKKAKQKMDKFKGKNRRNQNSKKICYCKLTKRRIVIIKTYKEKMEIKLLL